MKKIKISVVVCVTALLVAVLCVAFFAAKSKNQKENETTSAVFGIIQSYSPMGNMSATPGQKSKIQIVALKNSRVSVRVGAKQYDAKEKGSADKTHSNYEAEVVFPKSEAEISSIGSIVISASSDSQTQSVQGPTVFYRKAEASTQTNQAQTKAEQSKTTLEAQNVVPAAGDVSSFSSSSTAQSQPQNAAPSSTPVSTGLCMISTAAADTWPGNTNDDRFVPSCSTLIGGTMDYITGTSEAYDSEKKATRKFYNLSCGKRVLQSSVSLLAKTDFGDNALSIASRSENGELIITVSQKWKAPYSFSFAPQEYYEANGRLYNVKSFTATSIAFTFYHAASYSGSVSTGGSDVVSSASFSSDKAAKTVTLSMPLNASGKFYGYSAQYNSSGALVLTIHTKPKSLAGSVVLLDAGHGGSDVGATGLSGAVTEANVNLAEVAAVKSELEKRGATVYVTRADDRKMSLDERKSYVYSVHPDVFISIHSDATESKNAVSGTSSFYFRPMSKALSDEIHNQVVAVYKNDIYASNAEFKSRADRGSRFHPFSVARVEDCPSILLELGFMTNDTECAVLADASNRQKIAVAIANGIQNYFSNY